MKYAVIDVFIDKQNNYQVKNIIKVSKWLKWDHSFDIFVVQSNQFIFVYTLYIATIFESVALLSNF